MNGKDLLVGFGYIGEKLYEEAGSISREGTATRKAFSRPVLIAAVIALTMLLVGCGVLYALRLQDLSIGQESYTQHYDESGKEIAQAEKTRDILTLSGYGEEKIQKALAEWYSFLKTYDPEGKLATNVVDLPEIPNRYEYIYECYTTDMVITLEEIANKYGLKLLEDSVIFQRYQSHIFLEETGIGSLLREDSGAKSGDLSGMLYLPGNFAVEFELTVEGMESLYADYSYTAKEYLPQGVPGGGLDLTSFEQWDYAAPDGTNLLLALSRTGHGLILANQKNANIVISVDGNLSNSLYPKADDVISRRDLETIANVFDYSVCPVTPDSEMLARKLRETEEEYQAEHTYIPETYGSFAEYLKEKIQVPDETLQYTFFDLTGDGVAELLVGREGAYTEWVTLREGAAQVQMVQATYLCEGGVEERYTAYEIYESHLYLAPLNETTVDNIAAERQVLTYISREENRWTEASGLFRPDQKEITEAEAKSIMATYPRMKLDWKPLMDYLVDDNGTTLRDYLEEKDVPLSAEALIQRYQDYLSEISDIRHTHCRMLDINGDGVEDLLLSINGENFSQAVTYRYGTIVSLVDEDFHLCENGVLELVYIRWEGGMEMDGHKFVRITEFGREVLDFFVYNKASVSWQSDWYNGEILDSEAKVVQDRYPRIDQGMMPIEDLK